MQVNRAGQRHLLQTEGAGQDGVLYLAGHGEVGLQVVQLAALLFGLFYVGDLLHRLVDGALQVVQVDGLRGEVESARIHRLTYVVHVAVGRHHDALEPGSAHLVDAGQQGQSVHLGHVDVREDDVDVGVLQHHAQGFQAVVGEEEFVFPLADLAAEVLRQQQLHIHLVIDGKYFYGIIHFISVNYQLSTVN